MIAAAILTLVVIAYRVILGILGAPHLDWLHNFSPLAAVALCGAVFFPRKIAIALPVGALFISDLCLNAFYKLPLLNAAMIPQYVALGLVCALGWSLRGHPSNRKVLLASVGGSVLFYVVTNTGAWLAMPEYARSFQGWFQALTTGLPAYPPTLIFLRNSLASDLIFTALFLAAYSWTGSTPRGAAESEGHESLRAEFARRLR